MSVRAGLPSGLSAGAAVGAPAAALAREFQAKLGSRGYRATRQRERIAEVFFEVGGHMSAEELHARLKHEDASVGHATVYRTMKLLVEVGMASARHFDDGLTRFEPFESGEHHGHLICTGCGRIVEFENESIEALQDAVAARHGFVLGHHRMELYGLCPSCR